MPTTRDPRYRGRRRRPATQRPADHLRTNYNEVDLDAFRKDLECLYASWPQGVREADKKAVKHKFAVQMSLTALVVMLPVSGFLIWFVVDTGAPFYWLPIVQTLALGYSLLLFLIDKKGEDWYTVQYIYREAERRGIKLSTKYKTLEIYYIMNKINADYNSRLWNRKFKWI